MTRSAHEGQTRGRQGRQSKLRRRNITLHLKDIGTKLLHEEVGTHIKGVHWGRVGNTHIRNSHKRRGGIHKLNNIRRRISNVRNLTETLGGHSNVCQVLTITKVRSRIHIPVNVGIRARNEKVRRLKNTIRQKRVRHKSQVCRINQLTRSAHEGQTRGRQGGHRQLRRRNITLHRKDVRAQLLHEEVRTHIQGVHWGTVLNTNRGQRDKGSHQVCKDDRVRAGVAIHNNILKGRDGFHISQQRPLTTETIRSHITIHIHHQAVGGIRDNNCLRRTTLRIGKNQLFNGCQVTHGDIGIGAVHHNTHIKETRRVVVGNLDDGVFHNKVFRRNVSDITGNNHVSRHLKVTSNGQSTILKGQRRRIHNLLRGTDEGHTTTRHLCKGQLRRRNIALDHHRVGTRLAHIEFRTHIQGVRRRGVHYTNLTRSHKSRAAIRKEKGLVRHIPVQGDVLQVRDGDKV